MVLRNHSGGPSLNFGDCWSADVPAAPLMRVRCTALPEKRPVATSAKNRQHDVSRQTLEGNEAR